MSTTQVISASTHPTTIHDAVLDHYSRRLATCSSDKLIKIFDIDNTTTPPTHRLSATLPGHEAPVWSAAWSHPQHANLLATAGYDARVLIWKEAATSSAPAASSAGNWHRCAEFTAHTASINLVTWAPPQLGCLLAAASSDGRVSVLAFDPSSPTTFEPITFPAHGLGANSVSWAPASVPGQLTSAATPQQSQPVQQKRLATGGSDNLVKLWSFNPNTSTYDLTTTLTGHKDWVRDVAWSPTPLSKHYIASASQDHTVRIWTLPAAGDVGDAGAWKCEELEFGVAVWRVSWSLVGNVLAVSGGDNRVSLWKERGGGGWECVRTLEE
ncbi:hypothetical protein B0A50_02929 [Salinomyces thailandicus]|uniref:Protein transport protein SEC13 n=1 Tax=Salinomyces thailandicus TaxID=706561 RepID=A0A4U0U2A6_9PEZI|nr:hypothetical protein B0A50_02929 [Salinomyces thailandica]